ncbi:MAG: GTPase [Synechococcales bacterium]|nr:GTPase [Synechococcales bacterium]
MNIRELQEISTMHNNHELIKAFAEECKKKITEFDEAKVHCGLIGPSGSGKSSLINAIAGEKIAEVGVVETTMDPQDFTHKGIIFTDLPGCGTVKWPQNDYIERLKLYTYDCLILITAERFTDNDVFLFKELSSRGKPCFVVRNKLDRAIEDGSLDNNYTEEETRQIIIKNIRENLGSSCPDKIYLTSARHPTKYDLDELLNDITEALTGMKRERFIADMGTYSKEALKKKRKVAQERIPLHAGLAAANGLNPIPGVDISVDIGILLNLSRQIAHIYGLTPSQFEYIKRLVGPKTIPGLIAKVAQFSTKYLAKEGLILLLKRIASQTTAKQASKWIPFVGPLIAAGIGWSATFLLGEQIMDEAEALASEILEEVLYGST